MGAGVPPQGCSAKARLGWDPPQQYAARHLAQIQPRHLLLKQAVAYKHQAQAIALQGVGSM
jgi:hypothetical protein